MLSVSPPKTAREPAGAGIGKFHHAFADRGNSHQFTFGGIAGSVASECVLRNISATGAALQIDRRLCLPDEFKLNIPHGEIRQSCRVVWRTEALIGLAFEVAA